MSGLALLFSLTSETSMESLICRPVHSKRCSISCSFVLFLSPCKNSCHVTRHTTWIPEVQFWAAFPSWIHLVDDALKFVHCCIVRSIWPTTSARKNSKEALGAQEQKRQDLCNFLCTDFFWKWRKSVKGVVYKKKRGVKDPLDSKLLAKSTQPALDATCNLYFFLRSHSLNITWRGIAT